MGKRRATKLAILKTNNETGKTLKREIDGLNQMVENLKVLLAREVDKNETLETEIKNLSTKVDTKKPSKTKPATKNAKNKEE